MDSFDTATTESEYTTSSSSAFSTEEEEDRCNSIPYAINAFLCLKYFQSIWECYEIFPMEIIYQIFKIYLLLLPVHINNVLYVKEDYFNKAILLNECICDYDRRNIEFSKSFYEYMPFDQFNHRVVHRIQVMEDGKKYCQKHSNNLFTNILYEVIIEIQLDVIKRWLGYIGDTELYLDKGYTLCNVIRNNSRYRCLRILLKQDCVICSQCKRYCCIECMSIRKRTKKPPQTFPYKINICDECNECRHNKRSIL